MGDEAMEAVSSLLNKLETLPKTQPNPCIYKIPKHIRKISEECYQPAVVSIGPIHYKKSYLKSSQELKLEHLKCFLLEDVNQKYGGSDNVLKHYMSIVENCYDEARSYYEGKIYISRKEFIEMMIMDAVFIICLFLSLNDCEIYLDRYPMQKKISLASKVIQDVFLQDNQLPFFVLEKIYDTAFGRLHPDITFKDVTCSFIGLSNLPCKDAACSSIRKDKVKNAKDIKHLVDFLRICCLPPERSSSMQNREKRNCLCCLPGKFNLNSLKTNIIGSRVCCFFHKNNRAKQNRAKKHKDYSSGFPKLTSKELQAAGVKFKAIDGENLLDIKFENGLLQIPTLLIQESTEALLRSILFFEQCHYMDKSYFIDYAFFLDALIDTPEDVKILVKYGIIDHSLGSEDEVATMVNGLTHHLAFYFPNFYYSKISQRLNEHASKRWNRWRAILNRDYFSHPWSILSMCYLVILLILTILQVYTGFKQ